MTFYLATMVVYFAIYALGTLSMNLQFGFGGIANLGFILFVAAGAYAAALTSIGSAAAGARLGETYFWGTRLPYPLPLVCAGIAGGALALVIGPVTMRRMRRDYQAAMMLVAALIVSQLVSNAPSLLNGANGLSSIPAPLESALGLSLAGYHWAFAGWSLLLCFLGYMVCRRVSMSPFGRSVRAQRDDEDAAAAVGNNVWAIRMKVFALSGVIAGISGGLLVEYLQAWSPGAWTYQETFVFLQAAVLGGAASERGALVGAFLVGVVLIELPTFFPTIGYPSLIFSLQWIFIGLVFLLVLRFRPQGLVRERPTLKMFPTVPWRRWDNPSDVALAAPAGDQRSTLEGIRSGDGARKDRERMLP
jgi:branched-chain amino acid transport system permease protein